MQDHLIRDRIVLDRTNNSSLRKVLQERPLDMKLCCGFYSSCEAATAQMGAIASSTPEEVKKKFMKHRRKSLPGKEKPKPDWKPKADWKPNEMTYKFCGNQHVLKKSMCPALGKTCSKLHKANNFAVKCPLSERRLHHIDKAADSDSDEYELIQSISVCKNENG